MKKLEEHPSLKICKGRGKKKKSQVWERFNFSEMELQIPKR
jgi:hypothetical protein